MVISLTSSTGIFKRRTCTHRTISLYTNANAFFLSFSLLTKLQWARKKNYYTRGKSRIKQNEHEIRITKSKMNTQKKYDDDECNIKQYTQNINRRKRKTEWNSESLIKRKQHEKRCFQFHMYRRKERKKTDSRLQCVTHIIVKVWFNVNIIFIPPLVWSFSVTAVCRIFFFFSFSFAHFPLVVFIERHQWHWHWECATGVPTARIKRVYDVCRLKIVLRKAFDTACFFFYIIYIQAI